MAFQLLEGESPAAGARRLALQEVDGAVEGLTGTGTPGDPHAGIHEARRSLKRVRALLRLVRPALEADFFGAQNRAWRDVGRSLGPVRDAAVLVAAAERLLEEGGWGGAGIRESLARRRDENARRLLGRRGDLLDRLARARAELAAGAPATLAWSDLEGGLRRSYAEGRRALRRVRAAPGNATHHHEWRKRAKDLGHQVEFLGAAWPAALQALETELHRLTSLLGEANDLALLIRTLENEPAPAGEGRVAGIVVARAAGARDRIWEETLPLGRRIWAEPPAVFTRRVGAYWEAWRG